MPKHGGWLALALLFLLVGCGGGSGGGGAAPEAPLPGEPEPPVQPKPQEPEPSIEPGELALLEIRRQPPDAPLADLSHYAPRKATRAPDAVLNGDGCEQNTAFRYGVGLGDITGVASGLGMAGYADIAQTSKGLHNRQFARAFAFSSSCGGRDGYAMLVSMDIGLMFHSIRQGVLDALQADTVDDLGRYYSADNLLLSATHSHATAAGQAHHDLYNITTLGHDTASYESAVAGVVDAIRRAHREMLAAPLGPIAYAQGELLDTIVQRSAPAYANNPAEERARFVDTEGREVNVNRMMHVLRLTRDDGTDVGMLNWFAIHGTSMAQTNKLLSGDNKGYAAYRFERDFKRDYLAEKGFVAGFFQADEGDNSPNIFIGDLSERELRDLESEGFRTRGGGHDDFESTLISGFKQYWKARELWEDAHTPLRGEVAARQVYIDFSRVTVDSVGHYPEALAPAGPAATCNPALGVSFAAGAEDGRGPFAEGQACPMSLPSVLELAQELNNAWTALTQGAIPPQLIVPLGCSNPAYGLIGYGCHAEKPVLLPLTISPFIVGQGLAPRVVPLQIITLGNLAVIGLPWEVTTMSGRRIREAVLEVLAGAGVEYAVVSGVSNGYIHYLTTREEYAVQQYEGGSTVFGPWSEEAVRQEMVRLAGQLRRGEPATSPFGVEDFRSRRSVFVRWPFISDGTPGDTGFGWVSEQPQLQYKLSQEPVVRVSFVAGHPLRDLKRGSSYLYIEKQAGRNWIRVATDHDWETRYHYDDSGLTHYAIVEWRPPADAEPGQYRIRHDGASRTGAYRGISRPFELVLE